jgi:class 3 adenylate cyclase
LEYKEAKKRYESKSFKIFRKKPEILITDSYREYATRDSAKLEKTILKLGSLLVVGFGEAGAKIVGASIMDTQSIGVRPGQNIEGVFGYITIEHFSIVTEVLQDGIVMLVNRLAEIIHGIVDEFCGFTCKNTGSGFSLLWKLPPLSPQRQRICELALVSMCEIVCAINKSPVLATYNEHPHLIMRIPGYRVRIHAAIHLGKAIEGAVGSEMKLDASYLGTDVGLAQRLSELGNREYKSAILLSGTFANQLGKPIRDMCRQIDIISVDSDAGGLVELYTFDLDQTAVRVAPFKADEAYKNIKNPQLREYMIKQARTHRKNLKLSIAEYDPIEQFENTDLEIVRKKFRSKNGQLFNQLFEKSLLNYLCGEWDVAKRSFRQCLIFWLTHTSESRRRHVDDDASAPARRARALHAIQGSDDYSLIESGLDTSLMDGPSASLFRFIVSHELVLSRNNPFNLSLSDLIQRDWRGYRSY